MSSMISKHIRIARTASSFVPLPPGAQLRARATIWSTAASRIGAQWQRMTSPIASNTPDGSKSPWSISCWMSAGSSSWRRSATCAAFCAAGGFSLAGVEFSDECYCDNTVRNGASESTIDGSLCSTKCAGNGASLPCPSLVA